LNNSLTPDDWVECQDGCSGGPPGPIVLPMPQASVGRLDDEGENVAASVSGKFTPLQGKTTAAFNPPEIQHCIPVSLFWNFAPLRPNFEA
jgi:hypothetical protein